MHTPSGPNLDEGIDSPKMEIEKISANVTTDTNNEPDKTTSAVIKRLSIRCPVKSDTLDGSETAQYEPKMNTSRCKLVNYRTILGSNIRSLELKGFPKLESDTKTQATAELTRRRGMSARTSPPLNSPSRMQSPTSVQCATRTEEIQSDVSAHPFVTSGPDFEGEQTFRFDKAVKDMQIPSRPNFMKSDESLPLRIGDGVVSDDYVLPYKEWKVKDESSSTTKAKGRIIESSPTLEELPKLKPPENKIAILLKNIKKTPKKEEETIAVSLKDTDSSYENLTKPVIRFDSGPYETTLTQNHRQRSSGYHSTLERFTVLDKDDREYEEEFTALVLERTFPNQQNDNQQQQYEYCPMITCQPEHDIYQQQGYSRGYSQEENCFYQYPALTETHTYERDSLPYQNPTYLTDYSRYENATGYVMPTEAYNYPDDYNRQSVVYARDRQSVVYAPPLANQAAGSTLTYQRPAQEVHDEYLEHDYTPYAITLNPIPSSAGEADADVPQTVNFQDVGLRHREATENRETPGDAPVAIVDKVSVLSSIGKLVSGNRQSIVLKSYVPPTELTPKKKKRVKRDTVDKRLNSIYAIRYYPTPSELNLGLSSDDDHISTRAYLCLSLLSCLCCPLLAFLALWFTVQLADARKTGNKIAMSERGKLVRLFVISAIALGIVTYSIIIATTVFANIPVSMANNTVSQ